MPLQREKFSYVMFLIQPRYTGEKPSIATLEPVPYLENYADTGSTVAEGIFMLSRQRYLKYTTTSWNLDINTPNLASSVLQSNSLSPSKPVFSSMKIGSLLGHPAFPPPTHGPALESLESEQTWNLQSSVRFGVRGLMHFSGVR